MPVAKPGRRCQAGEHATQVRRVDWCPDLTGEYQPNVDPRLAGGQLSAITEFPSLRADRVK
jgi:hypothetical protein